LATTWRNAGAPRNLGDAGHWTPIPLVTCILADQLLLVRGISADDLNSKSIMQSHPHSIELRDPSCYDQPGRDGGGLADEVSAARVDREPGDLQAGPGSALGIRQQSPVRIIAIGRANRYCGLFPILASALVAGARL
jgi:hypothetical protein